MLDQFLFELCELFPKEAVLVEKEFVSLTLLEYEMMAIDNFRERLEDAQILTYYYRDVIEAIWVSDHMYEITWGGFKIKYRLKPDRLMVLT